MNVKHTLRAVKQTMPKFLIDWYEKRKTKADYENWKNTGKPIPPPHAVKKITIRDYQKQSDYNILVETGTYYGDMVWAMMNHFKSVYTIELAPYFYNRAVKRFKKYKNIHLCFGDSATELGPIVRNLSEPVIFWLDGHYSGGKTAKGNSECPIWEELNQITTRNLPHIILIDDARCFIGENDYPTIEELQRYFIDRNINHSFEVKDDIIRIVLK
jgi:hypothetical protein